MSHHIGYVINHDGSHGVVTLPRAIEPRITNMQRIIGGYFQLLPWEGQEPLAAYVNEEGRLLKLQTNPLGSRVSLELGNFSEVFVGPLLIVSSRADGLRAAEIARIAETIQRLRKEQQ